MEACRKQAPQDRQHNQVEGGRLEEVSTLSGGIVDPVQRTSTVPVFDDTLGHDLRLSRTPHGSRLHRCLTSSRRRESFLRLVHHICALSRVLTYAKIVHDYSRSLLRCCRVKRVSHIVNRRVVVAKVAIGMSKVEHACWLSCFWKKIRREF